MILLTAAPLGLLCRSGQRVSVFARMHLNAAFLAFGLAIASASGSAKAASTFYVATNGIDANPGTRGRPFRTFERAREAVRGAGQAEARKVIVRAGVYEFSTSFA